MEAITDNAPPCTFALRILGRPPHSPGAKDSYKGYGYCCICGLPADTHGPAWKRTSIIPESFGSPEFFARHDSPAACGACAYFAIGATFKDEIERRSLPVKTWCNVAWRSYSHVFSGAGHIVPRRADWRAFLLSPPAPPFLAIMTTAGTKNLLFRARVATDAALFPVLVEESMVWVDPGLYGQVLADFEAARFDGLPRDGLLTGKYPSSALLRVGPRVLRRHEEVVGAHRATRLQLLRLAHATAESPQHAT